MTKVQQAQELANHAKKSFGENSMAYAEAFKAVICFTEAAFLKGIKQGDRSYHLAQAKKEEAKGVAAFKAAEKMLTKQRSGWIPFAFHA